jgi:hypothetical protein
LKQKVQLMPDIRIKGVNSEGVSFGHGWFGAMGVISIRLVLGGSLMWVVP